MQVNHLGSLHSEVVNLKCFVWGRVLLGSEKHEIELLLLILAPV